VGLLIENQFNMPETKILNSHDFIFLIEIVISVCYIIVYIDTDPQIKDTTENKKC
jgi:hypothetical protein